MSLRTAFFLIFAFLSLPLFAVDVKVAAEIEAGGAENEPLKGTITITHHKQDAVDNNSFILGKNELQAEFVKDVQISPSDPLVLSIYSFTLQGQREGLYALPAISVKVGGAVYQSPMSSYRVQSKRQNGQKPATAVPAPKAASSTPAEPPPVPQSVSPTSVKPQLRLEAAIEGSHSLYPGQRTKLVYRYFFSGDIALTKEVLPLLDAEGFIRIGEKEINDSVQGTTSVRQISQVVEAVAPGEYKLGPSLIEGRAYKEDVPGNPVFTSDKLSSEAVPVVITVMPFPEQNKPASFNGAVGQFSFKTALLSSPEMTVGDEISLSLIISGKGNLKNITVPDLCCQPGMSGFFRLSDLPPSEEIEGDTKTIVAKFRPLNSRIKEIPSIEFSFFDPNTSQYTVLHSQPIPVSIKAGTQSVEEPKEEKAAPATKTGTQSKEPDLKMAPVPSLIQIESIIPLKSCDLLNKPFGSWWALAILPFSILLLIYQSHLKEYLDWKRTQKTITTSKELFQRAFADQNNGKCDFDVLAKSFKLALAEAGLITDADIPDNELPDEGLSKEVKAFWRVVDEKRFAGHGSYDVNELHSLSQELMKKIYVVSPRKDPGVHV
jgi:hypothetical protein